MNTRLEWAYRVLALTRKYFPFERTDDMSAKIVDGMSEAQREHNPQPDLRRLEGQLNFLDYHAPDEKARQAHEKVNEVTQGYWRAVASVIPDGPGKTRALHALNRARMEMNSAIANHGA